MNHALNQLWLLGRCLLSSCQVVHRSKRTWVALPSKTRLCQYQQHEQFYAHAYMHQMFNLFLTAVVYASYESQSWSETSISMPAKLHLQHATILTLIPKYFLSLFDLTLKHTLLTITLKYPLPLFHC